MAVQKLNSWVLFSSNKRNGLLANGQRTKELLIPGSPKHSKKVCYLKIFADVIFNP